MVRILRRNHSTASPGSMVFVNTETSHSGSPAWESRQFHQLHMGCATYLRLEAGKVTRRQQTVFSDPDDFWVWLLNVSQLGRPTWLFAHNLGFDLTVLKFWETLESGEWRISDRDSPEHLAERQAAGKQPWHGWYVDADPPTIISCKHLSGIRMIAVDTLNYWPVKLADLGKSVGLDKLPMPQQGATDQEWIDYCQRDVDVIEQAVMGIVKWVKDGDYGLFRYTAAGQAMAAYRHRFMGRPIVLDRPEPVKQLERHGYYGGQIEMLYQGEWKDHVWELDVQSMYPAIMRDCPVPRELAGCWMTDGPCPSPPVGPGEYTVAEVLVESYRETYPMRLADCTLYPHGMYWTVLCGRELQAAVERGHVVCFGRWASYSCDHLFKDYVDHFWGLRQQAKDDKNKLLERLCKTMLNSLYGKFGQLSPQWEQCDKPADAPLWGRTWEIDHETDERTLLRHLGKHCERQVERADHSKSFAAISAWITAAARERMRELVRLAGDRNCLYVVCDALYCTQAGFNNLQEAGEVKAGRLGKLTVKQYAQNARFIAPNNYRFGGRRVQSGIKADATPLGNDTYSQLEVQGLREITGGRPLPGVLMGERIVSAPKGKRKFHVDADGWTQPLVVYCNEPRHLLAIRNNQLLKLGDVW